MAIPSDYSGLLYWRDIDHAYLDAGVTPVATTGDLIQQFTDRSGNGFHMVQATSGSRADLQTVGGLTAARFNGGQFYTMGDPYGVGGTPVTAVELYRLMRVPSVNTTKGLDVSSGVGASSATETLYTFSDGNVYDQSLTSSTRRGPIAGVLANTWQIQTIRSENGRWTEWIDAFVKWDTFTNTFSATATPIFGKNCPLHHSATAGSPRAPTAI